jgi:hypothetical protein
LMSIWGGLDPRGRADLVAIGRGLLKQLRRP